jgi:putative tricarboxylic transport membrane protein
VSADTVAGGILFVLAVAYLVAASRIPQSSFANAAVGPKAVPIAIGVALALASLALTLKGSLGSRGERGTEAAATASPTEGDTPPQDLRKLGVVVLLLLGYILAFIPLGYVLSTFLFVMSATTFVDREHWVRNAVYAAALSVVVYVVFTRLLGVVLPPGVLDL